MQERLRWRYSYTLMAGVRRVRNSGAKTSPHHQARAIHFDAATVAALSASRSRKGLFSYFECYIRYIVS